MVHCVFNVMGKKISMLKKLKNYERKMKIELDPILGRLWNYVTWQGSTMARMDFRHPKAVDKNSKV